MKSFHLPILLLAFICLGVIYAWATPIFEASDELWHFGMVEYIAHNRNLPVQNPEARFTTWRQEGSQPPLYYAVAALLIAPFDLSDIDALRQLNPHAKVGVPGAADNKNMVLHGDWSNAAYGVYVLRAFGILLGCITIYAVYMTAAEIDDRRYVPLLAAGITAFNPMFLFIAASVNNDNLVTALNSMVILLTIRTLKQGFNTYRSLWIALLLALATLSKLSGLVLVPFVALSGLWVAYQRRDYRGLAILGWVVFSFWLVIAGWWYARNLLLYDELFGTSTMVAVAGPREEPFTLQTLLDEAEGFRIAYWGLFGTVNVLTFSAFYQVMDFITILGIIGLITYILSLARKRSPTLLSILLLCSIFIVGLISIINWTAQTYASQGRLLFPFFAATSTLLALGLAVYARWIPVGRLSPVYGLGIVAAMIPFVSIRPAYALPQAISSLPADAVPVYARYGDIELVGYYADNRRYEPGDRLTITLYLHPLVTSEDDYSLYIHLLDHQGKVIGKIDTYPGGGRLRTSTWQAGNIYPDEYVMELDDMLEGQYRLRAQVGWWHYPTQALMPPQTAEQQPLESVVLDVGGFAGRFNVDTKPFIPVQAPSFGEMIQLSGYKLSDERLTLLWETIQPPDDNYTVFVQVLDENNNIIGQGDAPPALPTRYWRSSEQYTSTHQLIYWGVPHAGRSYRLVVGWYHLADFRRLITDSPDNAYVLTRIIPSGEARISDLP